MFPVAGAVLAGFGEVVLDIVSEVVQRFDLNSQDLYVEIHDLSQRVEPPLDKILP